ncbi:MAG: GGDEF domain-containing protein [Rheinheimera sp.]|uniref:EAL domain-containing protein n=1 Tax=Arsukibacterium sp. UBA3155 TaxID=1946058 RepID=UPI000C8C8ACC|nr:EAL domain-containing protein [Arsukibacterium sp. UBA3155]MAD77561.1 GGDEF domain-containing protein [Rheinheimera sp.]
MSLARLFKQKTYSSWLIILASCLLFANSLFVISAIFLPANLAIWQLALLFNGLLALFLTGLFYGVQYHRRSLATTVLQVDHAIKRLEERLELSQRVDLMPELRLEKINDRLLNYIRRDHEVRHLVRVQGLIDHELAIGNRIFFESKLQHFLSDASEEGAGGLFIIEVSHPGHSVSQVKQLACLKACVEVINSYCEPYQDRILARLSENDLVLLLSGIAEKEMANLADTLVVAMGRANCFATYLSSDFVHIGYVAYQRNQTTYQLLSEADMALRTAQLYGHNSAFGFEPEKKPAAKGSVWWRSELTKALVQHRFSLSFQPVFSWQDQELLQQEVLVRLQSTEGENIPAAIFLPMAYSCGLTLQIDQHVLLRAAKLGLLESRSAIRCSVNINAHSLLSKDWQQWLEQLVASGQLDPSQLALELTEHHLIRYYDKLKPVLDKVIKLGFALVVDQVGLTIDIPPYADDLAIESAKLHPSVVRNIDEHLEQQLFVRGLISHFAERGIRVIGTGVELANEWQTLQKLGVAGGQGFYFSQPLSKIVTGTAAD